MFSRSFLEAASLLLLGSQFVAAQTSTNCHPMQKKCPADPAMNVAHFNTDFTVKPPGVRSVPEGWSATNLGTFQTAPGEGLELVMKKEGEGPTLVSLNYFMFGHFEVVAKAAPGAGVVSAITFQSDDLDEIDFEWIGNDPNKVQTNYFGGGFNDGTFDRGGFSDAPSATTQFHTYSIDWTADKIDWLIDGKVVRTLTPAQAGKKWPQTPMQIKIGPWPAGDSAYKGTSDWAGGKVQWGQAPFTMVVKSVKVDNYSPADSYVYTDMSGKWQSIKAVNGQIGTGSVGGGSDSPALGPAPGPMPGMPGPGSMLSSAPSSGSKPSSSKNSAPSAMPTGSSGGRVVSQIADGQIQAPTSMPRIVTQISDGQIQAPGPSSMKTSATPTTSSATATKTPVQQTKNAAAGLYVPTTTGSGFAAMILGLIVVLA